MSAKAWKCRIHFDGTKVEPGPDDLPDHCSDPEEFADLMVVDYSRPIDATQVCWSRDEALYIARTVSRNGGAATVLHRCPASGQETVFAHYGPYEVALAELLEKETY